MLFLHYQKSQGPYWAKNLTYNDRFDKKKELNELHTIDYMLQNLTRLTEFGPTMWKAEADRADTVCFDYHVSGPYSVNHGNILLEYGT